MKLLLSFIFLAISLTVSAMISAEPVFRINKRYGFGNYLLGTIHGVQIHSSPTEILPIIGNSEESVFSLFRQEIDMHRNRVLATISGRVRGIAEQKGLNTDETMLELYKCRRGVYIYIDKGLDSMDSVEMQFSGDSSYRRQRDMAAFMAAKGISTFCQSGNIGGYDYEVNLTSASFVFNLDVYSPVLGLAYGHEIRLDHADRAYIASECGSRKVHQFLHRARRRVENLSEPNIQEYELTSASVLVDMNEVPLPTADSEGPDGGHSWEHILKLRLRREIFQKKGRRIHQISLDKIEDYLRFSADSAAGGHLPETVLQNSKDLMDSHLKNMISCMLEKKPYVERNAIYNAADDVVRESIYYSGAKPVARESHPGWSLDKNHGWLQTIDLNE